MAEAKRLLHNERKTLQHIYDCYIDAQSGLTFKQVHSFLKDFQLLSDLMDTNATLNLYHKVLAKKNRDLLTAVDVICIYDLYCDNLNSLCHCYWK